MPYKYTPEDGDTEIEVFTADEVQAQTQAAIKAKEDEFGKTKAQIEAERDEARTALGQRTTEFAQFRKLNEDQLKKLTVAERTIYDNQQYMQEAREKEEKRVADDRKRSVETVIRKAAGTDENLFKKMNDMYNVINVEANTPEEIERKTQMVIGALRQTEPDLVASLNGASQGGSHLPPNAQQNQATNFADTDAGKNAAKDLGLILETPKK